MGCPAGPTRRDPRAAPVPERVWRSGTAACAPPRGGTIWHARAGVVLGLSVPGARPHGVVVDSTEDTGVFRFTAVTGAPDRAALRLCFTTAGETGPECFPHDGPGRDGGGSVTRRVSATASGLPEPGVSWSAWSAPPGGAHDRESSAVPVPAAASGGRASEAAQPGTGRVRVPGRVFRCRRHRSRGPSRRGARARRRGTARAARTRPGPRRSPPRRAGHLGGGAEGRPGRHGPDGAVSGIGRTGYQTCAGTRARA
ncbi:hypothetical protein GCM10010240_43380 [Streptomyces griseoviridis]|nr:hypothetical protein GCM10010240_43380 [Streptomyces griseoviridis]